jgi:glycosyltransferase involved in cell wall biosynthesis
MVASINLKIYCKLNIPQRIFIRDHSFMEDYFQRQIYYSPCIEANEYNQFMRLLFVTDARSPISQNWIRYFVERGDEVYLASTFTCEMKMPVKKLEIIPVAFSTFKRPMASAQPGSARSLGLRTRIRQWFGPLTISRSAQKLKSYIQEVKPDLVHAMRVPYEGMLSADAYAGLPLIVSIWGNDFTLHARSTPLMKHYTRWTMKVADAIHADCMRDIRLAQEWGFSEQKPSLVVPGNGGIRSDVFYPPQEPVKAPIIINPRGFRAYVRNESFFKAIPIVLVKHPQARFICSSMQGESQALGWLKGLKIEHAVQLNPPIPHAQMGEVLRASQILVSPSVHDGTPNSLLEGMACGCFPIVGDLESVREWITHGQNGLLVDSNDAQSIAGGILLALEREDLRREAAGLNRNIIATRAEYQQNMKRVDEFYKSIM